MRKNHFIRNVNPTKILDYQRDLTNIDIVSNVAVRNSFQNVNQRIVSPLTKIITYKGSFCEAVSAVLFVSRIFGILPLVDIRRRLQCAPPDNKQPRFAWLSLGTMICFAIVLWNMFFIGTFIHYNKDRINTNTVTTVFFHSMAVLIYLAFLHLAYRWNKIITKWTEIEQRFLCEPYQTIDSMRLKRKITLIGISIAVLSLAEHCLFQAAISYEYYMRAVLCKSVDADKIGIVDFFVKRFPCIYAALPHSLTVAITQVVSFFGTVAWNFIDLFIIMISIAIATRFRQLTDCLRKTLGNTHSTERILSRSMLEFRMDFIQICKLLAFVDQHMAVLIFLSCLNNLYFVCSQLLNAFNTLRYTMDYVYYWYSLFYLVGRTLFLFMNAAAVHECAEAPRQLLNDISADEWCEEAHRLLFLINNGNISLSAIGFFNFTRSLILTMIGVVVTFELVMMQFNKDAGGLPPLCG